MKKRIDCTLSLRPHKEIPCGHVKTCVLSNYVNNCLSRVQSTLRLSGLYPDYDKWGVTGRPPGNLGVWGHAPLAILKK